MKKTNLKLQKVPPPVGEVSYIEMECGDGFLDQSYSGTAFLPALIELIKNSRDWGASFIDIITSDPNKLVVVDNGFGMNYANRKAFVSMSISTAGSQQSGKYDTGTKMMLYSFSSQVDVATIDRECPNIVETFQIVRKTYQQKLFGGNRQIESTRFALSQDLWPYPYSTGTALTYALKDPKTKAIMRGQKLAEALSARCPDKFKDIIRVDSQFIPGKGDQCKLFSVVEQHSVIGSVTLELYFVDKRKVRGESLLFGSGEIGEVPFKEFLSHLQDHASDVPEIFSAPGVCGVIQSSYLKDYINSDRKSFKPTLADDKKTFLLIQLLRRYAPVIESRLGINTKADAQTEDRTAIEEFAKLCNKRYNPKGDLPPSQGPVDRILVSSSDDKTYDDPSGEPNLSLKSDAEYEIGEVIEIRISNPGKIEFNPSAVHWYTKDSHAEFITKTERGLSMVAASEGSGNVRMDVIGTPYSAKTHYTVVKQRKFRLNASQSILQVGHTLTLMGKNSDKLKGGIRWSLTGEGRIEPQGARVVYFATRAGKAVVTASDDKNPRVKEVCEIQVYDPVPPNLKIRDHFFKITYLVTSTYASDQKPVIMRGVRGGKMHDVFFNTQASGYKLAQKQGNLTQFLGLATALEFSRFLKFELEAEHLEGGVSIMDMPELACNMQELAYDIYSELLGQ